MAEIIAVAASIAGLISLAQSLIVPLAAFLGRAKSASKELNAVVNDITSFCGVLGVLQSMIEKVETGGPEAMLTGFIPCRSLLMLNE